jgi:hypothetical protein
MFGLLICVTSQPEVPVILIWPPKEVGALSNRTGPRFG